ncbi:prepilin-type N-terminal cleavage/methylation domain-containing protein [Terrimicrobium sacchariphilum]|uniref:Prepilin-type N-terminal cleavage/methylation domain-containing protein n=1 Tax=Terrimicrobium sacchariphilum TaxID=690879 RepID=A0A146G829_TERSA|nr:prepilin-type N-terminal cleavage/methylation domain-containing protein [Terrimicrobium sacchariphilum]GAT32878.1 prepilin-type N-terminal cleavage/methylation domain-containing protein [Terrimicrobium sacchariphilum]
MNRFPTTSTTSKRAAFTLIELLTVMAIVAILAGASLPAISSLSRSNNLNGSLSELAGLLSQARQYAVAQRTYVWVAMRENNDDPREPSIDVALLASKTGMQPSSPWAAQGTVPSDTISLLIRPKTLKQVRLEEAGTFTRQNISDLPAQPLIGSDNSPADGSVTFSVRLPGTSSNVSFDRVIQFLPDGEARVADSPIDIIEMGVRSMRGSVADQNNIAVLRINGLTGQTRVYRP